MKLIKKYLLLCLFTVSTTIMAADQPNVGIPEATTIPALMTTPVSTTIPPIDAVITRAQTVSKNQTQLKKNWLRNAQIEKIISRAQQSGQFRFVMDKLERMSLPKSLALIPVIESQYLSKAQSNKGASGIWQLMPATAKRFGIKASERYQLAPSTTAALKYFKQLHEKFGNWELAIAAYNAGEGRIQHALNKNPNTVRVQELSLPTETKLYVLKFHLLENYMSGLPETA